jgi:hypothetical protein
MRDDAQHDRKRIVQQSDTHAQGQAHRVETGGTDRRRYDPHRHPRPRDRRQRRRPARRRLYRDRQRKPSDSQRHSPGANPAEAGKRRGHNRSIARSRCTDRVSRLAARPSRRASPKFHESACVTSDDEFSSCSSTWRTIEPYRFCEHPPQEHPIQSISRP